MVHRLEPLARRVVPQLLRPRPRPRLGNRRRRQGLQAQDLHHRFRLQERDRLSVKDRGLQKLVHDKIQERSGDHQVHRHKILLRVRRLKVVHDSGLESLQAERRAVCQVVVNGRHTLRSQRRHLDLDRHQGVLKPPFIRHHSLQQALDIFLRREPFRRNHLKRRLQVLLDQPLLKLKLGFLHKELLFRKLLLWQLIQKLRRI